MQDKVFILLQSFLNIFSQKKMTYPLRICHFLFFFTEKYKKLSNQSSISFQK